MSTEIEINREMLKAVEQIPLLLRDGPLGRCLGAFAKPIAASAGSLATSSRSTGSREKWSKKFKNKAEFQNDSKQHFSHKVLRNGIAVYIGATYKQGLKQQFVMPVRKGDSYTRYHWGKPGSVIVSTSKKGTVFTRFANSKETTATFPKADRATVRAFDQNRFTAESAFLAQLNKEIKELRIG